MLSISERLLHSTVRIECCDGDGKRSSGTGFFFEFAAGEGKVCPAIVTNKHVIRNQVRGAFTFTYSKPDGEPDFGSHERFEILDFATCWIDHPEPDVDLAMVPIGQALMQLKRKPFYAAIPESLVPSPAEFAELNGIEGVTMIGYPNGLWDAANNLPIARRGSTATPIFRDYLGKAQFMIDAACFPGSSGSPVFLLDQGMVFDKKGNTNLGVSRLMFIGVLYAGPQTTATGEIVIQAAPTIARPVPVINMMMNLGICVRASKVQDFGALLRARGVIPPTDRLLATEAA